MAQITVNGIMYKGNNISITNGKIIVDGKYVTRKDEKVINISIEGDIENLSVDYCNKLDLKGSVGISGGLDIIGDVNGNILSSSGDICVKGNIIGNVETLSGDVDCKNISGNVKTVNGDISRKFL